MPKYKAFSCLCCGRQFERSASEPDLKMPRCPRCEKRGGKIRVCIACGQKFYWKWKRRTCSDPCETYQRSSASIQKWKGKRFRARVISSMRKKTG